MANPGKKKTSREFTTPLGSEIIAVLNKLTSNSEK